LLTFYFLNLIKALINCAKQGPTPVILSKCFSYRENDRPLSTSTLNCYYNLQWVRSMRHEWSGIFSLKNIRFVRLKMEIDPTIKNSYYYTVREKSPSSSKSFNPLYEECKSNPINSSEDDSTPLTSKKNYRSITHGHFQS